MCSSHTHVCRRNAEKASGWNLFFLLLLRVTLSVKYILTVSASVDNFFSLKTLESSTPLLLFKKNNKNPQSKLMTTLETSTWTKHTSGGGERTRGRQQTIKSPSSVSPDTIPINPACQSDSRALKIGLWAPADQTPRMQADMVAKSWACSTLRQKRGKGFGVAHLNDLAHR